MATALAKVHRSARTSVEFLHAAARHAEPGLHLIDQQHGAVLVAQAARRTQVLRFGRDTEAVAHDGLDQHAGNAACRALEHVLELVGIVGLHEVSKAAQPEGNALAVGVDLRIADLLHFSIGVYHMAASNSPW